jgi:hypothetical protein
VIVCNFFLWRGGQFGLQPSPLWMRPLLACWTNPGWGWIIMSVEQSVENLAEETKVLGENLPQSLCPLSTTNPKWLEPSWYSCLCLSKPTSNSLSYTTATILALERNRTTFLIAVVCLPWKTMDTFQESNNITCNRALSEYFRRDSSTRAAYRCVSNESTWQEIL